MESDGNNYKRIFFNWLLCLAVLLSIIALYISLGLNEKIEGQAEQIFHEQYSETQKAIEDFAEFQQEVHILSDALLKQQKSIQALEKSITDLSLFVNEAKVAPSANANSLRSNEANRKPVYEATSGNTSVYTIKSGDTFSKIATTFKVPLQKLLDANRQLNPRSLKVGQEIIIPK